MRRLRVALVTLAVATATLAFAPTHASDIGEDPILVAIDDAKDGAVTADNSLDALGFNVLTASIHQPDYGKPEIEFIWQLTDLQVALPPPEIARWLWTMKVNGVEYWVQAKTSDVSTATAVADDAPGTLTHIPGSFRLRGGCTTTGVATCHQIAWLSGTFDTTAKQVRVTVPLNLPVAPDFQPGAKIESTTIEVGVQAAVSLSGTTTDDTVGCAVYTIPTDGTSAGSDGGCG